MPDWLCAAAVPQKEETVSSPAVENPWGEEISESLPPPSRPAVTKVPSLLNQSLFSFLDYLNCFLYCSCSGGGVCDDYAGAAIAAGAGGECGGGAGADDHARSADASRGSAARTQTLQGTPPPRCHSSPSPSLSSRHSHSLLLFSPLDLSCLCYCPLPTSTLN